MLGGAAGGWLRRGRQPTAAFAANHRHSRSRKGVKLFDFKKMRECSVRRARLLDAGNSPARPLQEVLDRQRTRVTIATTNEELIRQRL